MSRKSDSCFNFQHGLKFHFKVKLLVKLTGVGIWEFPTTLTFLRRICIMFTFQPVEDTVHMNEFLYGKQIHKNAGY